MANARRRVLFLNYEYPPIGGGGGVLSRDLAEALVEHVDVTVLTTKRPDLPEEETINGVRIVRVPVFLRRQRAVASMPSMLSYVPASLRRGRALMRSDGYDLIHSFFAVPTGPSGVRLARQTGVPHVLSILGGDIYDPTKTLSPHRIAPLRWAVRSVLRKSDRVVAESRDIRDRAHEIYGQVGIRVIRHGFRVPKFQPVPRSELGIGLQDGDTVLIAVGRLVRRKRMDALLRVLARLERDAVLVIVGDGPLREELEEQAKALGVQDRVRFAGFVSDERKFQLLEAADLFVYTTEHEGFGIVYLEAMYCGLPVVTYDNGGQREFVSDELGALVPEGNEEKFLEALRGIIDDDARRASMSDSARRKAEEMELGSVAEEYVALYDELLRERNGSGA